MSDTKREFSHFKFQRALRAVQMHDRPRPFARGQVFSHTAARNWMTGKNTPTPVHWPHIADALGVTVAEITKKARVRR